MILKKFYIKKIMKFNPNKLIKLKIKHIIILINNDL
jgi:hypothetical protein